VKHHRHEISPGPGERAPDITFEGEDGDALTTRALLDGAAGRPLLLAFFKVTCPTCKLAWPALQRLHASYGGAVRVAGVSQNDVEHARAFFREFGGASFELLRDPEPRFPASNAFGVDSVPHVVLVEPDGTISRAFAGWSAAEMTALGAHLAERAGLPHAEVVPAGMPPFKPG
jgi:peroxiredoxin